MTLTIAATAVPVDYGVLLRIDGLASGRAYTVSRNGTPLHTFSVPQGQTQVNWTDTLAPFGSPLRYTVALNDGSQSADSAEVVLPWAPTTTDTPMWQPDVSQALPIIRSVAHPDRYVRVPVTDYSATFGFRTNTHHILGSQWPVVNHDVMEAKTFTVVVLTPTSEQRRQLLALLRESRILHLRAPCVDGIGDLFWRPTAVAESVPRKSRPLLRQWQIDGQQVRRPPAYGLLDSTSALRSWEDVGIEYASWDAVALANRDWEDLATPDAVTHMAPPPDIDEGSW